MRALLALTATLILFSSRIANASVYIEPLAGYQQANNEYTLKPAFGGTSDKATITGFAYGAELGYMFHFGLRLGADLEMANQSIKTESTGVTSKWITSTYVFTVGYVFPKNIVGYVGVGTATSSDDQTLKTTLTGMALKLGGQHEFINHIAVRVEYLMYTWNDTKTDPNSAQKISDLYDKFNSMGVQASIVFPFEFGGK